MIISMFCKSWNMMLHFQPLICFHLCHVECTQNARCSAEAILIKIVRGSPDLAVEVYESTRQICEVSKDFDEVWWKLNDIDGFSISSMKSINFCDFVGVACALHAQGRQHSCHVWEEWAVPSQRIAFLSWSLALLENVSFGPQVFDFKTRLGLKHLARRAGKIFMKCKTWILFMGFKPAKSEGNMFLRLSCWWS